jgi:hypothetical protein
MQQDSEICACSSVTGNELKNHEGTFAGYNSHAAVVPFHLNGECRAIVSQQGGKAFPEKQAVKKVLY